MPKQQIVSPMFTGSNLPLAACCFNLSARHEPLHRAESMSPEAQPLQQRGPFTAVTDTRFPVAHAPEVRNFGISESGSSTSKFRKEVVGSVKRVLGGWSANLTLRLLPVIQEESAADDGTAVDWPFPSSG